MERKVARKSATNHCKMCGEEVVIGHYGPNEIVLGPRYPTFAAAAWDKEYPDNGDRLFVSLARVEHRATCKGKRSAKALKDSVPEKVSTD